MASIRKSTFRIWLSCLWLAVLPTLSQADDIDLFVGSSAGAADNPNILILLDNSSNWAAANQGWPTDTNPPVACGNDCNKQGYYELKALRTVLNTLPTDASGNIELNVGLMLFNNSTASRDGAYVRSHVRQLTGANKAALIAKLDTLISNFNTETAAASVQYAAALFDAFKYFGGYTTPTLASKDQAPATNPSYSGIPVFGTPFWGSNDADGAKPDGSAYSGSDYVPVSTTSCGKNFIIFVGNGFPGKDNTTPDMGQVLKYLTNPSSPPSSITEYQLQTYSCSGTWSNTATSSCSSSCTAPANSAQKLFQCAKSNCSGQSQRLQECTSISTSYAPPTSNSVARYADEFADYLYRTDVSSQAGQQNVVTYTIDVYKDQPSVDQTALLRNVARFGGGKYFAATDENSLISAFRQIFIEIKSVNSTFASASLPINATNRAQNENQVFIGMFRPDPDAKPRWFGNLKRYQLILDGGEVRLGDINGTAAINNNTGFINDCATSWWTTDSPNPPGKTDGSGYWSAYIINPNPATTCLSTSNSPYSDSPDGSRVEKGGVAEVIRKGNAPPGTDTSPTWSTSQRTVYTVSSNSLQALSTANSGLSETLVNWMLGKDTEDENSNQNYTETRASIHGDVAHSRPLPVNYCTTADCSNVVVYYGANDGTLRAVDASTGKERWALVAPEFAATKLDRLRSQSPLVAYPSVSASIVPTPTKRDYFFDGSIGLYQTANNSTVWIYPTMRRGGRMVYALDVTNPSTPTFKWKFGCDESNNCTTGATDMGQTWSIPNIAFVKGYSSTTPVAVVGGGYDSCEDENSTTPNCSSAKGKAVYVLDADTGALIKTFTTLRSVVADVSMIDLNFDGAPDLGYVGDTGGNLYRIAFASYDSSNNTYGPLSPENWTITRIAYTEGAGRKFLFTPALFGGSGQIFIALGSGDREHPLQSQYPYTTPVTNRFYVYRDCLPALMPNVSSLTGGNNLDDTTLMTGSSAINPAACMTVAERKALASNCSTNKGWFIDLNNGTGEQTVTSAVIAGGMVTFSTNRPIPAAAGTCATSLGEARGYWLDLYNGSGAIGVNGSCGGATSAAFIGGGLPPSPVVGTVPIEGKPTTVIIGAIQKDGTASSPISPQKSVATNLPARKRVYSIIRREN